MAVTILIPSIREVRVRVSRGGVATQIPRSNVEYLEGCIAER